MDATVSARVPVAVKEQGNSVLRSIGATPSQLINAAYEFVLANHRLPHAHDDLEALRGTHRSLTSQQHEKIQQSLRAMYVGPSAEDSSFIDQLNAARDERYADFA